MKLQLKVLNSAITVGLRMAFRFKRLLFCLFLIQFIIAVVFATVVFLYLKTVFSGSQYFSEGVHGDFSSLLTALSFDPTIPFAILYFFLGILLIYLLVSWFLIGGVIGTFQRFQGSSLSQENVALYFAAKGAQLFLPFCRLALWSLIPYAIAFIVLLLGLDIAVESSIHDVDSTTVISNLLIYISPAFFLFLLTHTIIDYGRIILSKTPRLPARKAIWRSLTFVLKNPATLLHQIIYVFYFLGLTSLYYTLTIDIGSAVALLLIRQFLVFLRLIGKLTLISGQIEIRNYNS